MTIFADMVTKIIIAVTILVSVLAMGDLNMRAKLMFNPYLVHHDNQWYRFFSAGLIHADWAHLGFNMFSLYIFGEAVEQYYSFLFQERAVLFFVLLYVLSLAMSSMVEYERNKNNLHYNSLGASGAVSAVIFSYIVMAPTQPLSFLFLPIDIPAYIFGIIFLGVEYYMDKRGNTNIGHNAHFWGAVHGALFTIILHPALVQSFIEQMKR